MRKNLDIAAMRRRYERLMAARVADQPAGQAYVTQGWLGGELRPAGQTWPAEIDLAGTHASDLD